MVLMNRNFVQVLIISYLISQFCTVLYRELGTSLITGYSKNIIFLQDKTVI